MNRAEDFLMDLWRDLAGLPEIGEKPLLPDLEEIRRTQWCPEFDEYSLNRMVQGAFRYGLITTDESKGYDHLSSIPKRIEEYKKTGNPEVLFDIRNLCMLQYIHGGHVGKPFNSVDDVNFHSDKL